jgi:hypothetical protein
MTRGSHLLQRLAVVLALLLLPPIGAAAQDVIHASPGENVTLHTGYNFDGTVWVKMFNPDTGEPVEANFWSIKEFWNTSRGRHAGSAAFDISGLRDELRAGGINQKTVFLVTASGGVWGKISSDAIQTTCEILDLPCKDN